MLAVFDKANGRWSDAESMRYINPSASISEHGSNLFNLFLGELCAPIALAFRVSIVGSTLSDAISHIVGCCSN